MKLILLWILGSTPLVHPEPGCRAAVSLVGQHAHSVDMLAHPASHLRMTNLDALGASYIN